MTVSGAGAPPGSGFQATDVGWIGVVLGLAATLAVGLLRSANAGDVGPGPSTGSVIAFTVLLAGPAVVGAIGSANRRREVLVAAGLAYLPLAVLSFSGVTLVLLIPAALFVYAGLRESGASDRTARRRDHPAIAVAIVGLLTVGLIGLFATMTAVCWEETADGTIREREVPAEEVSGAGIEVAIGAGDVIASGCSSGVVSSAGMVIVSICAASAFGLAARAGRPGH